MQDLPQPGDRVALQTLTGRAFSTVTGLGWIDRQHQRKWGPGETSNRTGIAAIVLVDLDREHRGELMPDTWTEPVDPPTISISTLAVALDQLEAAETPAQIEQRHTDAANLADLAAPADDDPRYEYNPLHTTND